MIVPENVPIEALGRLGQEYPAEKSRVSAIITERYMKPAKDVEVVLLDATTVREITRKKTDSEGRVVFEVNARGLPVILRPIPPKGMVVSPEQVKLETLPVEKGLWPFRDVWGWDESAKFNILLAEEEGEGIFTFRNILIAGAVLVAAYIVYNTLASRE